MNTSIVMCAYDNFKWQRHITLCALNAVRRFTDRGMYELILVDTGNAERANYHGGPYNRWDIIKPDKHFVVGDIGYSAAMNLGVKESSPGNDVLVFMHNDVFVQGGWLPVMQDYLKGYDYIYPDQIARTRENIEEIYKANIERREIAGYDEAGLIMMKRSTFEEIGGWDEEFKSVYQDLALHHRMTAKGKTKYCTTRTFISHIGSVGYAHDDAIEERMRGKESQRIKEKYQ